MKHLKELVKEISESAPAKTFQDASSDQEEKALWEASINAEDSLQ